MNNRTRLALELILVSLTLGALGDALLRVGPWGLNAPVWTALMLAGAAVLAWRHRVPLDLRSAWPMAGGLLAAAGMAWRDAGALKFFDLVTLCVLLALALWRAQGVRLGLGGVAEQVWRVAFSGIRAAVGYVPLFLGPPLWGSTAPPGWGRRLRVVAVGILLALPLLLVFGVLFVSADAVFRDLLQRLFDIDLTRVLSHVLPIAVCSWVTAGWLIGLLMAERLPAPSFTVPQVIRLGGGEIGVALGLVNLLFFAFILVQLRFLFGSADLVEVTPGLTYAEYARRGFFELVAAATLAVPTLLLGDWLLGNGSKRAFRLQALALVVMLGIVLASAFHRLRLYQSEYGWTELRFYVTVFIAWLAAVLVWFVITVLGGRRERFAFGAMLAGFALLAGLHVVNPDAWIVRKNLAHAQTGRAFDAQHAARLSADAFPALASAWNNLDALSRGILAARFQRWTVAFPQDWRTWSWSTSEARTALERIRPEWEPLAQQR